MNSIKQYDNTSSCSQHSTMYLNRYFSTNDVPSASSDLPFNHCDQDTKRLIARGQPQLTNTLLFNTMVIQDINQDLLLNDSSCAITEIDSTRVRVSLEYHNDTATVLAYDNYICKYLINDTQADWCTNSRDFPGSYRTVDENEGIFQFFNRAYCEGTKLRMETLFYNSSFIPSVDPCDSYPESPFGSPENINKTTEYIFTFNITPFSHN